jgi:hypothetical protein
MRCFDIIESHHRHDFVSCKCGTIFLDGGVDYVRYGGGTLEEVNLLTEYKQGPQKWVNPVTVYSFDVIWMQKIL